MCDVIVEKHWTQFKEKAVIRRQLDYEEGKDSVADQPMFKRKSQTSNQSRMSLSHTFVHEVA